MGKHILKIMSNNFGTPQNLDELGMLIASISGKQYKDNAPEIIKDYIAQAVGGFMLKYPDHESILRDLFNHLSRRKSESPK